MCNKRLDGVLDYHSDIMQDAINKMMLQLEEKKTTIIKDRLKQLGIKIDFEAERKRRFKSIACVRNSGLNIEETYYFNDGSIDGIRIVTFTEDQKTNLNEGCTIGLSLNYF